MAQDAKRERLFALIDEGLASLAAEFDSDAWFQEKFGYPSGPL